MDDAALLALFDQVPRPPAGAVFSIEKVANLALPHPYTITARHVEEAADYHCGRLGVDAIEAAERKGVRCGWHNCHLPYKKHECSVTLYIRVPQNQDLNAVPGLVHYLNEIKLADLGIEGFAFPGPGQ